MKKACILLFIFTIPLLVLAGNSLQLELVKAAGIVNSFFTDFKTISREKKGYNVSRIKMDIIEKFFELSSEQSAPNEFNALGFPNDYKRDISVTRYVNFFHDMFLDVRFQTCTFDFDVLTNQSNLVKHRAEFTKNETPVEFARIVVRKTYKKGYTVLKVLSDTLVVNIQKKTICQWANNVSTNHIGGNDSDIETENYEQMRLNAELAYDRKDYYKAFQIYEKIISKYPKEGDPYYKMAVIIYSEHKNLPQIKNYSRTKRTNIVLDYLDSAVLYGGYNTRKWADNMKYWITGGQLGNRI